MRQLIRQQLGTLVQRGPQQPDRELAIVAIGDLRAQQRGAGKRRCLAARLRASSVRAAVDVAALDGERRQLAQIVSRDHAAAAPL